jgi:hypothetical protein
VYIHCPCSSVIAAPPDSVEEICPGIYMAAIDGEIFEEFVFLESQG